MPARTKIVVELTPNEAEALWTAANNGRNDFLCDPVAAKSYFGSPRGIGNANRAIDKLAKASRGKIALQPLPALTKGEWIEKQFRKKLPPLPRKPRRSGVRASMTAFLHLVSWGYLPADRPASIRGLCAGIESCVLKSNPAAPSFLPAQDFLNT